MQRNEGYYPQGLEKRTRPCPDRWDLHSGIRIQNVDRTWLTGAPECLEKKHEGGGRILAAGKGDGYGCGVRRSTHGNTNRRFQTRPKGPERQILEQANPHLSVRKQVYTSKVQTAIFFLSDMPPQTTQRRESPALAAERFNKKL